MCDSLFGGGGNEELAALMRANQAEARRANDIAAQSAEEARKKAEAAMVSPADSEPARQAAERRMRRLMGLQQPEVGDLGAAPAAYKALFGA